MEWENSMGHLKGRWWEWSGIKSVEVLETSQVCSFATQTGPCPEKVRKDQRERQTTPDQGLLFSCRVVSDSLWPNGLQHSRLFCPSLSLGVCSNSYPLSQWYHPTISSSVASFSSCPQSFPGSGSFPKGQLFASGGQSSRASVLASVLPMSIQGWFPLGLTGWISLLSKGLPRVFSNTTVQKHQFFGAQ